MWLITNFGFFSIVEKSSQKGTGTLTVRARVKSDLETLRDTYLPAMGTIEGDKGTDYKWRAVAPAAQVAAAFCKAVADIDYSNFKNSVQARQGKHRHDVYSELWSALWKLADEDKADDQGGSSELPRAYGGIVFDKQGRLALRKPKGEYDGYVWTFPKGRPDGDEPQVKTAQREVREEVGVEVEVLGRVPKVFRGGTTENVYFLMDLVCDHGDFDRAETEKVIWATPDEARKLISETRNATGRRRDLAVLDAALAARSE